MALTKITAAIIEDGAITASALSDNSIGITQLNVSDGTAGQFLKTDGSGTLSFATVTGYTDSDVDTKLAAGVGNILTTGYIAGPATFTIDPAAVGDNTGTLVVAGNLQVDGTTTTINSTTMTVDDLNITLASGAANAAAANGAGITVDGASATLLYQSTPDAWSFNKNVGIGTTSPTSALHVSGNVTIDTDANSKFTIADGGSDAITLYGGTGDELYIGANSAYKLRFKTDGNIVMDNGGSFGIGTTSPDTMLHLSAGATGVAGGGDAAITMTNKYDNPDNSWKIAPVRTGVSNTGLEIRDVTDSRTDMVFDGSGKVGIGQDTPAELLHVKGTIRHQAPSNSAYYANRTYLGDTFTFGTGETSDNVDFKIAGGAFTSSNTGGNFRFFTQVSNGTPTERMRIDSSGRVGINRTPSISSSKLEIGGADNVPLINFEASGATAGIGIGAQSGSSAMRFYYGTTERASLNLHGAWKVKSTSGAYFNSVSKYHEINSNDGALTTVLIRNGSTYYANCANFWLYGGAPNNTQSQFWTCNDTGGQKASIQSNGGLHNYQSNNSNLCDEREKKNIEVLPSTWNSVKSWNLKKFHYNEDEDSDDKRLGVIAQEIETTNPELITEHTKVQAKDEVLWTEEDDLPEGVSIGDTKTAAQDAVIRKGVKEQQMYIMAIKALQEALTKIETLETRIQTLEDA